MYTYIYTYTSLPPSIHPPSHPSIHACRCMYICGRSSSKMFQVRLRQKKLGMLHRWVEEPLTLLGGPFDLVSRVSKVGYGDYNRASRGY